MDEAMYPSFQFDSLSDYGRDEAVSRYKEDPWFDLDESGLMDLLSSVLGPEEKEIHEPKTLSDDQMVQDDFCIPQEIAPNLGGVNHEDAKLCQPILEKPHSFLPSSWDLLNSYGKGFKMPREESLLNICHDAIEAGRKLSTEEILRMAGEKFIQFSTSRVNGISMFIHPYGSMSGLSIDDARDVELVHLLLAAAENVAHQLFDVASKLISRCLWVTSVSGTPVQRVAFYFAEALQERINRESGKIAREEKRQPGKGLALCTNNTFLLSHQELPFIQVTLFSGMQAILENVKTAKKIHLIDLQIRSGIQWTALMQGLAETRMQQLKITALGTTDQQFIEETGKRLSSFAESLNLEFSFKAVYLTDMQDFKESALNVEADECIAIYSNLMLRSMISRPDCLENLMKEITKLKPTVMVVVEVEANHNSPSFIDRFTEALFFYSAFFDCLEDCMERDSQARMILEGTYFGEGIMNIIATECQERITRNVKIDVWRAFLARFGMSEIELSESSKYQASLVLKQFTKGSSCTLEMDGKGLIVGWKGTPIHSLTIWNFS